MTTPHKLSKEELDYLQTHFDNLRYADFVESIKGLQLLSHIAAQEDDYSTAGNGMAILREEITKLTIERDQLKRQLIETEAAVV